MPFFLSKFYKTGIVKARGRLGEYWFPRSSKKFQDFSGFKAGKLTRGFPGRFLASFSSKKRMKHCRIRGQNPGRNISAAGGFKRIFITGRNGNSNIFIDSQRNHLGRDTNFTSRSNHKV